MLTSNFQPSGRQPQPMAASAQPQQPQIPGAKPAVSGRNPLVQVLNLHQLEERHRQNMPEATSMITAEAEPQLVGHIRHAWERNKLGKDRISRRLINCLRARRGVYSAEELAVKQQSGGVNLVWYDLTETKCRAASAWVREIVLPSAGELPWGLDTTAIPDLPPEFKRTIVAKSIAEAQEVMQQVASAGGGVMPSQEFRDTVRDIGEKLRNDAEEQFKKASRRKVKRMERQIQDRLEEGGWTSAMDAFVEDFVTFPAAFLKGPIWKRHKTLAWTDGYKPKVVNEPKQSFEHVSAFDIYPQSGSASLQHGDLIERMRFFRSELHDMKGLPGYQDDQIDDALMDYSAGHLEGWIWTESERQRLEGDTLHAWLSPNGMIDALNYWGSVPGWMLKDWGIVGADELEDTRDYECNAILVGRYLIYAALNPHPLGSRPYRSACYDAIPGSLWGRAIPELADMCQKMCNVHACAIADNVSLASGPMVWIYMDQLADGEQSLEVMPWKLWQLKSKPGQTAGNPGIGFFQAEDRSVSHMQNLEKWEMKSDDVTGIPRYTYGNERVGGAGNTASGLSMLLNNAAKGLRRGISDVDAGVIAPSIQDVFVNEMLYNPDQSIKGDAIVVPKGAAAILIKDAAQARRQQFLGMTANPIDMQIIGMRGRATLLRETAQAMELPTDEIVPSDEELIKREEESAQAAQAQQQAEQQAQQQALQQDTAAKIAVDNNKFQQQAQQKGQEQISGLVGDLIRGSVSSSLSRGVGTRKQNGATEASDADRSPGGGAATGLGAAFNPQSRVAVAA